ncbi:precorrin-3B C(17)-methyltransferase (plasmid) [Deinococcus taeanensis]|uniref:precorrin-3B C(17)-methyltransferase n=1 Tax=Deinococcus taeanensis TaxID=2737050 RepID=UPI001CDCEA81|nr:precorrin-3B C(17)-methyltransferase [Deinococcus taeanensis]UBV44399.1 precorrin-3B C(17)-methyltransferase [Deinococcus taeanensis]
MTGHLSLVSVGPGDFALVPERARQALREADVIVAYDLYLRWVQPLITTQEVLTPPLTQEKYRAELAIRKAAEGKRVALVSSGDIGVYAMAGLVFEDLPDDPSFGVEVIPGITSATACASLLGSPLTHDFATLSLSDLLCPWEWIANRASHIAQADLACVLYNVQSKSRRDGVYRVVRLMLEHKRPDTVCGVVRNAYREDQDVRVTTLEALLHDEFDMLTTIVIGNRFTTRTGRRPGKEWMYTPRGYNDWQPGRGEPAVTSTPDGTIWVFSGTRDGNALALQLAESGESVTLSVASDLGAQVAPQHPGLHLYSGPSGVEARRRALRGARAVVDATHPYAQAITRQLQDLSAELGLPYFRYERPSSLPAETHGMILVDTFAQAAQAAAAYGRVFLATGSKDLEGFLHAAPEAECYVRLTPQPDVLRRAQELGVPAQRICAMIGPFSREFNVAQWAAWQIGAVVTKESGTEGGFPAKVAAARELGIPLIVVRRPPAVPGAFHTSAAVLRALRGPLKEHA